MNSSSSTIQNPIIRGFNPDPSIVRVGGDYYIATSTFEWVPGVPIYHSRNLADWTRIGHALPELDLHGIVDSGGVWAPSLSFHDGLFWLVYTVVKHRVGAFKDLANYLTTSENILGPWSEPVFLNTSGFDPSLFHDDDGRKWIVNMEWDFRKNHSSFAGILLQEYDHARKRLICEPKTILQKNSVLIEGPNLYKRGGFYYLMLAEGGTGWNHGISMARSRAIAGPYELDSQHSVMTSRGDGNGDDSIALQKAGHGELVETQNGDWYLVHLASRPIRANGDRRCVTGRETCLQKVYWNADGWLRLDGGGTAPKVAMPGLGPQQEARPIDPIRDDFDLPSLSNSWSSLRTPVNDEWLSLTERPGWLRLRGRESLHSWFDQSLIARRLTEVHAIAETCAQFEPTHYTQMAGLICWYDTRTHFYLRITRSADGRKVVGVVQTDDGVYDEFDDSSVDASGWDRVYLRAKIDEGSLSFFASPSSAEWQQVGPTLDASKLSDDYGQGLHFTGAMVGICAQDLGGAKTPADFDYFSLECHETPLGK